MKKIVLCVTILAGTLFTQAVNGNSQEERANTCLTVYNSVLIRGGSEVEARLLFEICMIRGSENENFHHE